MWLLSYCQKGNDGVLKSCHAVLGQQLRRSGSRHQQLVPIKRGLVVSASMIKPSQQQGLERLDSEVSEIQTVAENKIHSPVFICGVWCSINNNKEQG